MAAPANACPGTDTFARFVEGVLEDDAAARVRKHVADCTKCRALLVDAGRDGVTNTQSLGDKYTLECTIASGGMGRVVRAKQTALGRNIAIKLIHPHLLHDGDIIRRFEREARATARLRSPHVVQILDIDWLPTSGEPFIVMEYLEGADLGRVVERDGPLPPADAVHWILQACHAIAEAHAANIIHRDIKPQNLFLTNAPARMVKVLDFGLAKILSDGRATGSVVTTPNALIGSPRFMSPEQIGGGRDIDKRTDVWSIGATLHYLLTGESPFEGDDFVTIRARVLSADPSPLRRHRPDVPEAIVRVVEKCLQRDPCERFQTVTELAAELSRSIGEMEEDTVVDDPNWMLATAPMADVALAPRFPMRRRVQRVAIAALGLVALATSGLMLWESEEPASPPTNVNVVSAAEAEPRRPDDTTDPPAERPLPRKPYEVEPPSASQAAPPRTAPRPPRPPPRSSKHCDPPYTIDSIGRRIYNRDCL